MLVEDVLRSGSRQIVAARAVVSFEMRSFTRASPSERVVLESLAARASGTTARCACARSRRTPAVLAVAMLPLVAGCGTAVGAVVGGALGAAGGAAIETVRGGNPARGAVYGGIVGAAAGGYYGYQKDEEERRRQEAVAAAQAAAQARAAGETRCTSREQWSNGKLVVHEVICDSSVHRSGFRGDPVAPPAAPPTVIYEPAVVERYPYRRTP